MKISEVVGINKFTVLGVRNMQFIPVRNYVQFCGSKTFVCLMLWALLGDTHVLPKQDSFLNSAASFLQRLPTPL